MSTMDWIEVQESPQQDQHQGLILRNGHTPCGNVTSVRFRICTIEEVPAGRSRRKMEERSCRLPMQGRDHYREGEIQSHDDMQRFGGVCSRESSASSRSELQAVRSVFYQLQA